MKFSQDIEADVIRELLWAPDVNEKDVAVKATGGLVTLSGFVGSYREKNMVESAAKRVEGITELINNIEVRLAATDAMADSEISREALAAIKQALPALWRHVSVQVHQGRVTLEGELEWFFQRYAVEGALRPLDGIVAISNLITVKPSVAPTGIKRLIEDALRRSSAVDGAQIAVDASGSEITLRGSARSLLARDEALRMAWSAPGVTLVRNEIAVES
jgi:osmotically-inducible protein OsmY